LYNRQGRTSERIQAGNAVVSEAVFRCHAEEKRELRRWVNAGHSPYENGDYIVNDDGGPMDFINALRLLEVEYQEYLKDPDSYRGGQDSEEYIYPKYDTETGDELPF